MTDIYQVLTKASDIRPGDRIHLWEAEWKVLAVKPSGRGHVSLRLQSGHATIGMRFKATREIPKDVFA